MPPDFVQLAGIAETLGVSKRTAQRYIARTDFPPSSEEHSLPTGRVWRRTDVEAWGRKYLPLPRPGRPPKRRG